MKIKTNETFTVPSESFGISAPPAGSVFSYSVCGENWSAVDEEIDGTEDIFVIGVPKFCAYKITSDEDVDLYVQY